MRNQKEFNTVAKTGEPIYWLTLTADEDRGFIALNGEQGKTRTLVKYIEVYHAHSCSDFSNGEMGFALERKDLLELQEMIQIILESKCDVPWHKKE